MPAPTGHLVKFTLSGTIGTTGQTWSTSFWVYTGIGTPCTQALLDSYATAVRTPAATFIAAIRGFWSPTVSYTGLKATHYLANSAVPDFVSSPAVTLQSGATLARLPGYCAFVASLRSTSPTRSGRGRMYLPVNFLTVTADGEIALADVTQMTNASAALFTAVNALAPGFDSLAGLVVVASFTKGTTLPVTRVVGDSKLDVQHRRTNKLGVDSVVSANV